MAARSDLGTQVAFGFEGVGSRCGAEGGGDGESTTGVGGRRTAMKLDW